MRAQRYAFLKQMHWVHVRCNVGCRGGAARWHGMQNGVCPRAHAEWGVCVLALHAVDGWQLIVPGG